MLIQTCYENYIKEVKESAEQQNKTIKAQEFDEIKSHIYNYAQEKGKSAKSEKQLQLWINQEFGKPQELLDNICYENVFINQPKKRAPIHLVIAIVAIGVAMVTPYKLAPMGFLFLFIALHAAITREPFAFAYYKKNPDKINQRGPFWVYIGIVLCLGLFFLMMEWRL